MGKIMEIVKKNTKLVVGIIIGVSFGCIGVMAATLASKDVSYTNQVSSVTNVQEAIEDLYNRSKFKFRFPNLSENGLRYTGINPTNYVSFHGELWRIIGIFDGKMKIIRNESIGEMPWDSGNTNDWESSSLYRYLNTTYYNSLNNPYKMMIENATWMVGGWKTPEITTSQMYEYERNTKGASSSSLITTGYVGLMNASDYGYASSGCYEKETLNNYGISICTNTNWLKLENSECEWTITSNSLDAGATFCVHPEGCFNHPMNRSFSVRPVLYLKSNVYISGGEGTHMDPYTLEM